MGFCIMSLPYQTPSKATAADHVGLPLTPPRSPSLSTTTLTDQSDIDLASGTTTLDTLRKETKKIVCLFIKHTCYCFVLSARICLLPLAIFFRHFGFFRRLSSRMLSANIPTTNTYSDNTSVNLQGPFLGMIVTFWMYAADAARGPVELYHRIDRLTTLLEEHLVDKTQTGSRNNIITPPLSDVQTNEFRLHKPATPSQVYHAALADDKTLDKLLASFNGEESQPFVQSTAMQGDTYLEVNSAAKRSTRLETDTGSSPALKFEVPEKDAKFSVKTSPTWMARLGYDRNSNRSIIRLSAANESCPSLSNEEALFEGSVQSSPSNGRIKPENSSTPETIRCVACDLRSSDSDHSTATQRERKRKQMVDTPAAKYHTVPVSKRSNIPKATRMQTKQ